MGEHAEAGLFQPFARGGCGLTGCLRNPILLGMRAKVSLQRNDFAKTGASQAAFIPYLTGSDLKNNALAPLRRLRLEKA